LFFQNGKRELKFKGITLGMHGNSIIDIHPTSIVWQNERRESTHSTLTAKRSNNYIHQLQVWVWQNGKKKEENAYKIEEPRFSIDSSGFSSVPEILVDSVACWRFSQDSLMQFYVVPVIAQKKIPFFLSFSLFLWGMVHFVWRL